MNVMWLFTLLLLLAGSGCSERALKHMPDVSTSAGPPNRTALIRTEHLPNVELTTHEGRAVRFYEDLVRVAAHENVHGWCGLRPRGTFARAFMAERDDQMDFAL